MTWSDVLRRWDQVWPPRVHPVAADLLVMGASATLGILGLALDHPARWPLALAAVCVEAAALAWRRRWPLAVLAVLVATGFAVQAAVGGRFHSGGDYVGVPATIYSLGYGTGRLRWAVFWYGLADALYGGVDGIVERHDIRGIQAATFGLVICGIFLIGDSARTRRAYLDEVEARFARQERDRELDRQRAADEERARIARELHDVVTHHVSAIAVQAEANRAVQPDGPGTPVLASIAETARVALDELARLLGVLRPSGDSSASLEPEPSLAQLDDLVTRARAAGQKVRLRVAGEPRPLPAALELSAYRIVQEATTNARKHAPGARVEVSLRYQRDGLGLRVVDDGAGAPAPAAAREGRGLIGMRERVALFGGSLEAGPVAGGGFQVVATLPAPGQES